jgi:hypothetical protein
VRAAKPKWYASQLVPCWASQPCKLSWRSDKLAQQYKLTWCFDKLAQQQAELAF